MIRNRTLHASLLCSAASAVVLMAAGQANAQEARFSIDPQPLSQALTSFSEQSQTAIIFTPGLTSSKTTQGFEGAADVQVALNSLLAGTGLSWRRDGDAFVIVQQGEGGSSPQAGRGAGGAATVEALIVTAQKREEDIQDVPIAISAFSQEDLTRSQIAGGPDLITQVPNMTFTKTNFSSYSVQLRGIGTQAISATTDPAVAVALNNTPFIRNRFFEQEFYDLQRVEVLRGPQGTLYGRNATAGVVNIITAKPKFLFEAKASGDLGNYNSSRIEGMVNIPLVEDAVALRVAGAWTKRDGYAFNELSGKPIDGRDLWSTRVSLRISPNDRIDANLIWEHFEEDDDRLRSGKQLCKKHTVLQLVAPGRNGEPDRIVDVSDNPRQSVPDRGQTQGISTVQSVFSQGCERESLYSPDSFQTPNGQSIPYYFQLGAIGLPRALDDPYVSEVQSRDLRVIESTIEPTYRAGADLGQLQISFDVTDSLTLTSETAYGTDFVYSLQDFNRFNTAPGAWRAPLPTDRPGVLEPSPNGFWQFCDPQLGCSDRLVAVDVSTDRARQFSQEFRLSSDFDGDFNFSLGANYLRADSEAKYYVFINSLTLIAADNNHHNWSGPYVRGETDNVECLLNGYMPGDPEKSHKVSMCIYIDPNPVESVNDEGHNYFLSKNPYKLISYAVFGEAYYNVTDALKVTAGLRWTVDKKDAPRVPSWVLASFSVGYPVAEVVEQEWREPTGRLTVDWKPELAFTDETLLYASYAHGYKAGGANPPTFAFVYFGNEAFADLAREESATRPKTFDAEFVDAFELGAKNTLLDGRATLNLAAFYYDYKGYQISEIVDRSAFNRNFDATVWGLELEADWRPLENLKLGFKGGYQETSIADGEQAVDLMDRTAGVPGWSVVRPFPTFATNCILPTELYMPIGGTVNGGRPLWGLGGPSGGNPGGCEWAYIAGFDPGTEAPFDGPGNAPASASNFWQPNTYPGFDPFTGGVNGRHNFGEGFFKQLGGNELPNAPNWTGTITADYTLPLTNDWLATLHTDLHWQAESWWRIFNDHEYNKLDEYFTMNLAAIFTNEERGWNIMAYVKNVTDETAITGAFLNSDDTGLTTNVFLTEPRLYGLRVTKAWTGGPLLGSFGARREGPYPFTLELGGQVQRHDAPNGFLDPSTNDAFETPLDVFDEAQEADLDWGDGRSVKLTWRPSSGPWTVSVGARYGKTNGRAKWFAQDPSDPVCGFLDDATCEYFADDPQYGYYTRLYRMNHVDARVYDREEHEIVDFTVGRDLGLGSLGRSVLTAGLRYAQFTSDTDAELRGVPDWYIPRGFVENFKYVSTHTVYDTEIEARREFEGAGPVLSWEAALPILERGDAGQVDVEWSVAAGALFGKQKTAVTTSEQASYFESELLQTFGHQATPTPISVVRPPPETFERSESVTVPTYGATLGLSYAVGGFKVGAGYRWERYQDAIDGGYDEAQDEDRTIDGPYFKLSVGFGGG